MHHNVTLKPGRSQNAISNSKLNSNSNPNPNSVGLLARAIDLAVTYLTEAKLDLALQYVHPGASENDTVFAFVLYVFR